ncbi:hypothetical protein [Streptomyces sp. Y1]|uniref:Transposase n=1 Tax=Streptomyces sp. Y1 TaxID=3238634 RepID=A0AB39TTY0_9ACTN
MKQGGRRLGLVARAAVAIPAGVKRKAEWAIEGDSRGLGQLMGGHREVKWPRDGPVKAARKRM